MLVGAHVGATLGAVALLPARARASVDLRLLVVCALLPDLIDKALLLVAGRRLRRGAFAGHSVLAALLVALVAGPRRPAAWAYAGATAGHLVLDGLWGRPATLLWPLLGLAPEAWMAPSGAAPSIRGRGLKSTSTLAAWLRHAGIGPATGMPGPGRGAADERRPGLKPTDLGHAPHAGLLGLLRVYGQILLGNAEQSLAELVGMATLVSLAHQWHLYRWRALRALLATGRIRPTIEPCA
jgi:hypothetical protein